MVDGVIYGIDGLIVVHPTAAASHADAGCGAWLFLAVGSPPVTWLLPLCMTLGLPSFGPLSSLLSLSPLPSSRRRPCPLLPLLGLALSLATLFLPFSLAGGRLFLLSVLGGGVLVPPVHLVLRSPLGLRRRGVLRVAMHAMRGGVVGASGIPLLLVSSTLIAAVIASSSVGYSHHLLICSAVLPLPTFPLAVLVVVVANASSILILRSLVRILLLLRLFFLLLLFLVLLLLLLVVCLEGV
mmetsp:Transcript_10466/g.20478  ORF Transcript_10466/g.20478 Transcript_10466/m.20478 type:complete len:240 (-) Transcript_10466:94-813(-)